MFANTPAPDLEFERLAAVLSLHCVKGEIVMTSLQKWATGVLESVLASRRGLSELWSTRTLKFNTLTYHFVSFRIQSFFFISVWASLTSFFVNFVSLFCWKLCLFCCWITWQGMRAFGERFMLLHKSMYFSCFCVFHVYSNKIHGFSWCWVGYFVQQVWIYIVYSSLMNRDT